jgi:glucose-1-phosphate adenylyltransferase
VLACGVLGTGENTIIRKAVVDRNVSLGRNVRILNEAGVKEGSRDGFVISDGIVVVMKDAVIPDGTVI